MEQEVTFSAGVEEGETVLDDELVETVEFLGCFEE